jgi:L-asparaginase
MPKKSILVLYAGGTIGMTPGPRGFVPSVSFAAEVDEWTAGDSGLSDVSCRILRSDALIDSADATPAFWHHIADAIWNAGTTCDGVVIAHGTDTLAYTAGALSFLLADFNKPIVLTGAQVPFSAKKSDAKKNLLGAIRCAAADLREVCIFFDGVLLRGNRARKRSTASARAFTSAHWPALGHLDGAGVRLCREALLAPAQVARSRPPARPRNGTAGLLKIFPGIRAELLLAAADACPAGLVLELYGVGTGPVADKPIESALERLASRKFPLVGVSQCVEGAMTPNVYENSRRLADLGVANGHDLTAEAALCKLYSRWCDFEDQALGSFLAKPIAGELTPRLVLDPPIG